MELKVFRVTVRGHFDHPDTPTRERLIRNAPQHDIFLSAFRPEGCFVYDERLVAFNLRYELRDRGPHATENAEAVALKNATAFLERNGIPFKHLRVQTTDMGSIWSEESSEAEPVTAQPVEGP
jgi:hypothetical protein